MRSMGFVISHKNRERRRALLPKDLKKIQGVDHLYFETGYGRSVGFSDQDYLDAGARVVTREEALGCDCICDMKLGDQDYLDQVAPGKFLFGWAHAVQDTAFTTAAIQGRHTVLAWEELYDHGRYVFYRNREIAGEAAVLQAFLYLGKMPYESKVAIYGSGHTAKGAMRILHGLGAEADVYKWKQIDLFRRNMGKYDMLINCCMWDTSRTDRLIYREDLKNLKRGAMIVDVSCDPELEIETSRPTTIDHPVYEVDGILHYAVDNTPAMFPITVSKAFSRLLAPMVDAVLEDRLTEEMERAVVIRDGVVLDQRIHAFRERYGIPEPLEE